MSFIQERLEKGKSFVISSLDDALYDIRLESIESDFIDLNSMKFALTKFSAVADVENQMVTRDDISKYNQQIQVELAELEKEQITKTQENDEILLAYFFQYALDNWIKIKSKKEIKGSSTASQTSESSEEEDFNFLLNEENSKSVFSRIFGNVSYFFNMGKCYQLYNTSRSRSDREKIVLKGRTYYPRLLCTSQEFDEKYSEAVQTELRKKIRKQREKDIQEAAQRRKQKQRLEKILTVRQIQGPANAMGVANFDKKHYIYITVRGQDKNKQYYVMPCSKDEKMYGWFPPCLLALEIKVKDGKLVYDTGRTNNMRILGPAPYKHPAISIYEDPHLCLHAGNFKYKGKGEKFGKLQMHDFFMQIKSILKHAKSAIKTGLANEIQFKQTANPYNSLDEDLFKEYRNNAKKIGWADKKLDKRGFQI